MAYFNNPDAVQIGESALKVLTSFAKPKQAQWSPS
jgi:hypothetical protein